MQPRWLLAFNRVRRWGYFQFHLVLNILVQWIKIEGTSKQQIALITKSVYSSSWDSATLPHYIFTQPAKGQASKAINQILHGQADNPSYITVNHQLIVPKLSSRSQVSEDGHLVEQGEAQGEDQGEPQQEQQISSSSRSRASTTPHQTKIWK